MNTVQIFLFLFTGSYEDDTDECSVEKRLKISEVDIGW
jgi:hypothetical protein